MSRDDRTPLTSAQRALAAEHFRLVFHLVGRMRRESLAVELMGDDAFGEGFVGLCRAAKRYDPARGTPFHKYAYPFVRFHVLEQSRYPRNRRLRTGRPAGRAARRLEAPRESDAGGDADRVEEAARRELGAGAEPVLRVLKGWRTAVEEAAACGMTREGMQAKKARAVERLREVLTGG